MLYRRELTLSPALHHACILRPNKQAHLQFLPGPRTLTHYGDRAFPVVAPKLWNRLPINICDVTSLESFQSHRTHFFFHSPDFGN